MMLKTFGQNRFSLLVIMLVCVSATFTAFNLKLWKIHDRVIDQDVIYYYEYLPATFIHNDLTLSDPSKSKFQGWFRKLENGNRVNKMTMGMAYMYSPFFAVGHLMAKNSMEEANGYTKPYKMAIQLSAIFYLLFGMLILMRTLKLYFSDLVSGLTLIFVGFGTNLYYYATVEATMTHVASFFLITSFLYSSIKWTHTKSWKHSVLLGITLGLLTLIRPTNVVVVVFIPLLNIDSLTGIKQRIRDILHYSPQLIAAGAIAFIFWIPQFIYWKTITGNWVFYSYGDEGFYFLKPEIIKGLFSFRKGWLIYTPIMFSAVFGIFLLKKRLSGFFLPVLVFFILNLYVIFSWWCWWYGGSYSQRSMIDSYGIMAIPIAVFVQWIIGKKKPIRLVVISAMLIITAHGLFQTYQYYTGKLIHWDSMTAKAFRSTFCRLKKPAGWNEMLQPPDYEAAKKGLKENVKD